MEQDKEGEMKHEVAKDRNKRRTTAYLGRIEKKKHQHGRTVHGLLDGKAEINHQEKWRR